LIPSCSAVLTRDDVFDVKTEKGIVILVLQAILAPFTCALPDQAAKFRVHATHLARLNRGIAR
jgi:hypothetical protein